MDFVSFLIICLIIRLFLTPSIFSIFTLIRNPEAVRDDGCPGSIDETETKKDEADDDANEHLNAQSSDLNNIPEVSTIDGIHGQVISDNKDENGAVRQNGSVPNALEAPDYIDENNESPDECPNSPVPVLNDNEKALPISEVEFSVVPVVNEANEVTKKRPTFVLGNEPEALVINDSNERSNATEIQSTQYEPVQSAANEPPKVSSGGNGLVDRPVEFDFSVLGGLLPRAKTPQYVKFSVNNPPHQETLRVDVANFFSGYLKITAGTTGNPRMSITIEKARSDEKMSLQVKKYDPELIVRFNNRQPYGQPCEYFENFYGKKFTSTVLNIDFDQNAVRTLVNYKKQRNEFGMMMLELQVGDEVKIGYIRFDWDSIISKAIVPSFYNYHLQMGDLKITGNEENRLEYCRNERCNNGACLKPICSRFIEEAYFKQATLLTLIYLPSSEQFTKIAGGNVGTSYDLTVEKNFEQAGLRYLFPDWRTMTTDRPHEFSVPLHAVAKKKNPFGINFGNPRTRNKLIEWLKKGKVFKVNINLWKSGQIKHTIRFELSYPKRKSGQIEHTIRFELRHPRDVDPKRRKFRSYSSSKNHSFNRSFSTLSMCSSTRNSSFA